MGQVCTSKHPIIHSTLVKEDWSTSVRLSGDMHLVDSRLVPLRHIRGLRCDLLRPVARQRGIRAILPGPPLLRPPRRWCPRHLHHSTNGAFRDTPRPCSRSPLSRVQNLGIRTCDPPRGWCSARLICWSGWGRSDKPRRDGRPSPSVERARRKIDQRD